LRVPDSNERLRRNSLGSGINASLILFPEIARFRAAVSGGLARDVLKSPISPIKVA
jgi:hypothetical protein